MLTLASSARMEIDRLSSGSGLLRPAAQIVSRSSPISVSQDFVAAMESGNSARLDKACAAELLPLADRLAYELAIVMVDEARCRPQDLHMVDGLVFCMPTEVMRLLDLHELGFEEERFFLTKAHGDPDPRVAEVFRLG